MSGRLASIAGAVVATVLLIGAISVVQTKMTTIRTDHQLIDTTVIKDAPPTVAFVTVALGGFRGILADILFLRCQKLHEQENYFEHVQLADWLVKLQPKFTGATSYLAWNMAYNVSVTFSAPEDRWRWVQRGIELVRDEALKYHTTDPKLYWQLGWIFQHKVGDILDDANRYYKAQYALQVMETLGYRDGDYDWQALSDAPDTWSELRTRMDAEAEKLDKILANRDLTLDRLEQQFRSNRGMPEPIAEAIAPFPWAELFERTLRRRWLQDRLSLNPDVVVGIIEKHGPLDFRLPEANAVYWATMGLKVAPDGKSVECKRMITQAMADAFRRGKLVHFTQENMPIYTCNAAVAETARVAYLDAAETFPDNKSFMSGYENFMKDAIVLLYTNGYRKKADEFRHIISNTPRFAGKPEYKQNIDQLALQLIAGDVAAMSTDQIQSMIVAMLNRSHLYMSVGADEEAATLRWTAEKIYKRFKSGVKNETVEARKGVGRAWETLTHASIEYSIVSFHPELREALINRLKADGVDTDALLEKIRKNREDRLKQMEIQNR
jgi:hypothetical protein